MCRAARQQRHHRRYHASDEVSSVQLAAGDAAAPAHGGPPDFADFISGRLISPAGYLGTTPTTLIGRDHDLARLAAVLTAPEAGLVTVTGPAGIGKSRLVMEFFRRRQPGPGAVEVLDFGKLADASVCRLMLRQLNEQCREGSRTVRAVLERLGAGRHTVLLDHYEDVADELAPLLAEFRRCCPQVRIVSAGTTRLGLYGERVVRLGPLPTGELRETGLPEVARIPAVELFVACARSVLPEFTLTAQNAGHVLAVCRLLGGLPFAIELAATQATVAGPELILERFERGLDDLRGPGHHPYSRHASIRDLISWVLGHLSADERMLLSQLAIFAGPFTMRAAAEVTGRSDDRSRRSMERLIDKSALIPGQRQDAELSLTMPNVLRLSAAKTLGRLPGYPALRKMHGEYFLAVARGQAGPEMRADLLAAFGYWREAGDGRAMAVIADALRERCAGDGQALESLRLTRDVLRTAAGDPRLHAHTLRTAGELAMRLGSQLARGYLRQALDAYRALPDDAGTQQCLRLLGEEAYAAGDLDQAREWLEESLAIGAGADGTRPCVSRRLAVVLRESGSLTRAADLARAALAAELGRQDVRGAVLARYVLATICWLERDSAAARALFADSAEQLGGLPEVAERPECLEMLAVALWKWRRITDWSQVTALLGLADWLRRRSGLGRPGPLTELLTPILAACSQELTAEEYASAWRAGPEMSWAAALRLVPGSEPTSPDGIADVLTKRELEVALLVAEGLTNRVIAHRLGIAEWTVVNHVRKVMRKLECQSRVHVTRRLAMR